MYGARMSPRMRPHSPIRAVNSALVAHRSSSENSVLYSWSLVGANGVDAPSDLAGRNVKSISENLLREAQIGEVGERCERKKNLRTKDPKYVFFS